MSLLRLARVWWRRSREEPLITLRISRSKLIGNLQAYRKRYPGLAFAPVLKSNAYGHGLGVVAEIFDGQHAPFLVVDSFYEAAALRGRGVTSAVLVVGYVRPESIARGNLRNIAFTVTSLDHLRAIARVVSSRTVLHWKVDTGMRRQGILPEEVDEALTLARGNSHLVLEGLCSHFADADNEDATFTESQIVKWNEIVEKVQAAVPALRYWHIAATAGIRHGKAKANVARLGLGLYGLAPTFAPPGMMPALSMRSIITSIRELKPGEGVGYNLTYRAGKSMKIATVPAGYFEGVDRRLSNRGSFLVRGVACPIVGRVSMNITSIDVTAVPDIREGDEVTIISDREGDDNTVKAVAEHVGTIPWEILVHIPGHLRREMVA